MFVIKVHVVDGEKDMTFAARIGFGFPQELYDIPGEVFFQPRKSAFKSFKVLAASGERDAPMPFVVSGGALVCKFCEHLVERRSNVMNGIGGNGLKFWRDTVGHKAPYFPIEIDIGRDFVRTRCVEGFDALIDLGDEGFGPFKFGEGRS